MMSLESINKGYLSCFSNQDDAWNWGYILSFKTRIIWQPLQLTFKRSASVRFVPFAACFHLFYGTLVTECCHRAPHSSEWSTQKTVNARYSTLSCISSIPLWTLIRLFASQMKNSTSWKHWNLRSALFLFRLVSDFAKKNYRIFSQFQCILNSLSISQTEWRFCSFCVTVLSQVIQTNCLIGCCLNRGTS